MSREILDDQLAYGVCVVDENGNRVDPSEISAKTCKILRVENVPLEDMVKAFEGFEKTIEKIERLNALCGKD